MDCRSLEIYAWNEGFVAIDCWGLLVFIHAAFRSWLGFGHLGGIGVSVLGLELYL